MSLDSKFNDLKNTEERATLMGKSVAGSQLLAYSMFGSHTD